MTSESFSLLQECTNKFEVKDINEKEIEIYLRIPKKYRNLWLIKLSELKTNLKEIEENE